MAGRERRNGKRPKTMEYRTGEGHGGDGRKMWVDKSKLRIEKETKTSSRMGKRGRGRGWGEVQYQVLNEGTYKSSFVEHHHCGRKVSGYDKWEISGCRYGLEVVSNLIYLALLFIWLCIFYFKDLCFSALRLGGETVIVKFVLLGLKFGSQSRVMPQRRFLG